MMASSTTKSYGASIIPKTLQRSISPSGKLCASGISSSPTPINHDRWGPPLISIHRGSVSSSSTSVRFSFDHRNASTGPSNLRSSYREKNQSKNLVNSNGQKKTCMCSPTTHPGSFRCSLHKNVSGGNRKNSNSELSNWHRSYARRLAMKNSLVRIGTIKGDLLKQAKVSLIRPSSNHQRRRCDFQPRPSRLSVMSKA